MIKTVIKRDGTEIPFDSERIYNAVYAAMEEVRQVSASTAQKIADTIAESEDETLTVEKISDMAEQQLMVNGCWDAAKAYIRYRYDREKNRVLTADLNRRAEQIFRLVAGNDEESNKENSNKDPRIIPTIRDYIAGFESRELYVGTKLPDDVREAHLEGLIHCHDTDYSMIPITNCCLINLEDMLQNGTVISGAKITKPHSLRTASTLASQIVAQVASSQYGGTTISLAHLAPFVDVSRQNYRNTLKKKLDEVGVDYTEEQLDAITEQQVRKEIADSIQTIQYQLITISTTNGQAAFVSVYMYIDEAPEGRTRDDLVLLIEEVLKQRIAGIPNEQGHPITIAFPKLLYVLDEDNIYKDSKYYWLTLLAAECTSKRLVPDYISAKQMRRLKEGNVFPCMGCVEGPSVIDYKIGAARFVESFSKAWARVSRYFSIAPQPNGVDEYIDTPNCSIYDISTMKYVPMYRMIKNHSAEWISVGLSDGRTIRVTPDHPFEIEKVGVVHAEDLTLGMEIMVEAKDYSQGYATIESLRWFHTNNKPAYDVTTETEHFMVNNMNSHNCRSFLAPWKNEKGEYQFYGRHNLGVVTLNLADIGLTANGDEDVFWKLMDERAELCFKALMVRVDSLKDAKSDVAPILYQHGALARLKPKEDIAPLLYGGRASISLGYAGLFECVKAMTGVSHTQPDGIEFAFDVMHRLNEYVNKWKEETNLGFSLYGTPLESTTKKFAECIRRRHGIIEGITDKLYVTNSYHVNPAEHIDAFSKLTFESWFQELSLGGAISYIETPNMTKNPEAIMQVLEHIYETIMYAEINTMTSWCKHCGCTDIYMEQKDGSFNFHCPQCGNEDFNEMNIALRICGYISTNPFNDGRANDIYDRVYHLGEE